MSIKSPGFAPVGLVSRLVYPDAGEFTSLSAPATGSISIQYVAPIYPVTASRIDALMGWTAATAATTATQAIAISAYAAIFTRNGSTLSSVSSGSTQTTYSYASNSAGLTNLSAGQILPISVPVNLEMSQGEYYVAFNFLTTASSVGLSTTNLGQTQSMIGNPVQTAWAYGEFGVASVSNSNLLNGMGVYTVSSSGIPATMGISNIAQTGASLAQANIALVFRNY